MPANAHDEWSALPLNSSPDNTHTAPIAGPKRMAPDMMPLGDIRILSLEQFGAGPWGTMQLADLGADVIRIEDPSTRGEVGRSVPPFEQDGSSLFFESFNRNKRSLALDLRYPEGRSVLEDLVRGSDALFSNLRGDQPAKLRLRYDDLKHVNPRIVCVSLSGFGMTGPRASEGAYDATVQGLAGWMSITGGPDEPPMKSGLSLVDFSAGYVATIAVLAGIWRARREGVGCDADLSLFETALGLLNYMATWSASRGWQARRMPASAHQTLVPFQAFEAADGWLVVACPKETLWRGLCAPVRRRMDRAADGPRRALCSGEQHRPGPWRRASDRARGCCGIRAPRPRGGANRRHSAASERFAPTHRARTLPRRAHCRDPRRRVRLLSGADRGACRGRRLRGPGSQGGRIGPASLDLVRASDGVLGSRAPGGHTAVDEQRLAGHEAGRVRAQPGDGMRHLLRRAQPVQRVEPGERAVDRGDRGRRRAPLHDHRRLDPPRADRVHADPPAGVFECRRPSQPDDTVLRGVVGAQIRVPHHARDGSRVDDRPEPLRCHLTQLVLHAKEDAGQVDGEDAAPRFIVVLDDRRVGAFDAGVVEGAVQPAKLLDRGLDDRFHSLRDGDVAADEDRPCPPLADEPCRLTALLRVDVGEHEYRALLGEEERRRPPDARGRSGDERDLVLEERSHPLNSPASSTSATPET